MIDPTNQADAGKKKLFRILLGILFTAIVTLACGIGLSQSPMPGPFPFEGVRQMTFDYAFYKDLLWSPNGEYIAATRCPMGQFEPNCSGNEETVLIDPKTGVIEPIDFSLITANRISSSAITWSSKGDKLLMFFQEWSISDPAPLKELRRGFISYMPNAGFIDEIDINWLVIAWSEDGSELLLTQAVDENTIAMGWYSIETQDFREEIQYPVEGRFLGPFSLSSDQKVLLQSDTPSPTRCDEIQAYTLGSHEPFAPFLAKACFPAWSLDGNKLAYIARFEAIARPDRIMIANSDGSNPSSVFDEITPHDMAYPTWSPDGRQIAFTMRALDNVSAIYIVNVPEYLQSN